MLWGWHDYMYFGIWEFSMIWGWPRTPSLWLCVAGSLEELAPGLLIGWRPGVHLLSQEVKGPSGIFQAVNWSEDSWKARCCGQKVVRMDADDRGGLGHGQEGEQLSLFQGGQHALSEWTCAEHPSHRGRIGDILELGTSVSSSPLLHRIAEAGNRG